MVNSTYVSHFAFWLCGCYTRQTFLRNDVLSWENSTQYATKEFSAFLRDQASLGTPLNSLVLCENPTHDFDS